MCHLDIMCQCPFRPSGSQEGREGLEDPLSNQLPADVDAVGSGTALRGPLWLTSPWAHIRGRQVAKSTASPWLPPPRDIVATRLFLCIPHIRGEGAPKAQEGKTEVLLDSIAERNPTKLLLAKSLPDVPRAWGGPGNVECSGK